jgi:glycosyltransferase involved in cell wall biosynthesis
VTEACLAQVPWELEKLAAYEASDMLLPNSDGEGESIRRDLGVTTPMTIVPNGVDPERFNQAGVPFDQRDIVLSVGRIDPHKNQLGLIRALRGSGKKLVIVGYEHPDHGVYAGECRSSGAGWVDFIDGVPHDELREVFARARVHALPSWFETTGLVSLEAALSGCSVVSTDRGHAHEYLGDRATYCDPADVKSIRHAVELAWQREPSPDLRQYVLDHFTWDHVARATYEAYETVLDRWHSPGSLLQHSDLKG